MLKLSKYQKRFIIKEQVIETIQKIYDCSKEKYKKKKKVHEPIKQLVLNFKQTLSTCGPC